MSLPPDSRGASRTSEKRASPLRFSADWLLLAAISGICAAIRSLPERVGYNLSRLIVRTIVCTLPRLRRAGRRNLSIVFPEKDERERRRILSASLDVIARNFFWFAKIPTLNAESLAGWCDAREVRENLASARCNGKGVLIPTLHAGAFELFGQAQALLCRPASILARDFGLPRLDRWWRARREYFGNTVFSRKGGYREVIARLNSGEDVVVLFDQNVKRNHALFVPFFGIQAATSKAVALAALRTGAPVVFVIGIETAPKRCDVIVRRVPNPRDLPGPPEEQIYHFLEALHRVAEDVIRRYPEQWLWIHRRFKTRPEGEAEDVYR